MVPVRSTLRVGKRTCYTNVLSTGRSRIDESTFEYGIE